MIYMSTSALFSLVQMKIMKFESVCKFLDIPAPSSDLNSTRKTGSIALVDPITISSAQQALDKLKKMRTERLVDKLEESLKKA